MIRGTRALAGGDKQVAANGGPQGAHLRAMLLLWSLGRFKANVSPTSGLREIESAVHARGTKITSTSREMYNDLATVASAQDALAAQLAAVRPYAQIKATETADCRRSLEDFERAKTQPRS